MSYAETWEVSFSVKKRIELTRLVSRLQVKVTNATNHGLKLDGLTLGSFNNKTLLLGGSIKDWSGKGDVDFLPAETKTLQPMGDKLDEYTSGWMYVFESGMQEGFKLDFKTTSEGDGLYHAPDMHSGTRSTENKKVERNHIWNLNLWVCGYSLTLTLKGENPPIGGYPVLTSKLEGLNGTLYGGGPFTIEIGKLQSLNEGTPVPENIQWSIDGSIGNPEWLIENLQLAGTTITGRMAGYAINATGPLTFKLIATSGSRTISVFPVTLSFAEIFEQAQSQP